MDVIVLNCAVCLYLISCLQVDAAVAAAKEAFPKWSACSPEERAKILRKLADLIEANLEEFAQAESKDQGCLDCLICCHLRNQVTNAGIEMSGSEITFY